jgi:hypothetical protein
LLLPWFELQVVQHNFVCSLAVVPASLPAADSAVAGCSAVLLVAVETENQQAIPWDAISTGLTLSLEVPDAAADAAAAAGAAGGSKSKGGRSGKGSKRPEALVLTPECLFAAQQELEGLAPAAAEAAAAAATAGCVACFRTPQLTTAGTYTVAAEFRETRPELLPGLKKEVGYSACKLRLKRLCWLQGCYTLRWYPLRPWSVCLYANLTACRAMLCCALLQEQRMRSTSLQFDIAPGAVSSAVLQAGGADQEQFTISNGKDPATRRLLRNAVVQLYDSHSNAAAVTGVPTRWRLYCTDSSSARAGAEAPQLCVATGELQLQSNDKGRAFFGDVGVEEGTGKLVRTV